MTKCLDNIRKEGRVESGSRFRSILVARAGGAAQSSVAGACGGKEPCEQNQKQRAWDRTRREELMFKGHHL